jgi:hypothetical protein
MPLGAPRCTPYPRKFKSPLGHQIYAVQRLVIRPVEPP